MDQMCSGDQTIRFDREQTRRAYAALTTGDAERCGCSSCLNFAAQRPAAYPESFRLLLDQLGIDPEKEGEVYECGPEDQLYVYGGWFYFVGEFVEPGERATTGLGSSFHFWFGDAKRLPKAQADFGEKVLSVEFVTRVPWVTSKKP
jgi:hypothetical protein